VNGFKKYGIGQGAAYIYIETIIGLLSGYVLWFILSRIATPEAIGVSSAIISFSAIFAGIATIGVPYGISHFLGKSLSNQHLEKRVFINTSILIVASGIFATSTIVYFIREWINLSLDLNLIILSILLIATYSMTSLFRSIVVATLDTKRLPIITLVSSVTRTILAIVLVLSIMPGVGIIIGYLSYQVVSCFFLAYIVMRVFGLGGKIYFPKFRTTFKSIITASVPSWIPALITSIGSGDLGIIIIFGSKGASQAGSYFLAYAIFSAIAAVSYSLFTIAFPLLSGMVDGRKGLTWNLIKISLIVSLPVSSSIIFYSHNITLLFGTAYTNAAIPLEILLLSLLPNCVLIGVTTLTYSYGNFRQVLFLGLAAAVPRVILYFTLVGTYGTTGVAISYSVGSVVAFIVSIFIAKKIGLIISWRDVLSVMMIPLGVSLGVSLCFVYFNINYIVGIIASIGISYVVFIKLEILKRHEVENTLSLLPSNIGKPIIKIVSILGTKINREY
jgi:O-antigen/teichoic acid export membrane protein